MGASSDDYLQIYVANQTALAEQAIFRSYGCYSGKGQRVALIHFGQFLHFRNVEGKSATVTPYGGSAIGDDVSLADVYAEGGGTVNLRDAVDWLVPGMPYYVTDALFAIETEAF